jgi:hypothetical protein
MPGTIGDPGKSVPMPFELFQITAAYSNAMLVAMMPHVADFAKKLDLPTPQPITISQVEHFVCFLRSDHIGGRLVLTNGCEFIFDHGHVQTFVSPHSYYYLQDPRLVPTFYGPIKITEAQTLKIAHDAIRNLGYTDTMLSADKPPRIDLPPRDKNHLIARYRIIWHDPKRGSNPSQPPRSIEFEIDATTGRIQMVNIYNPNTYLADLKIDILPQVIGQGPTSQPVGPGRKVTPVSPQYARTFLNAILPQLADFVRMANLSIRPPVSTDDIDMAKYVTIYSCGIVEGDTQAFIDMKSGDRFVYSHGQVTAFYSHDAMDFPEREHPYTYPGIDQDRAKFYGPINITTNDAVNLVRQTIKNLAYSESVLHVNTPPRVDGPGWWGTNRIARCFIEWRESIDGPTWVNSEVDMASHRVTSLYINNHAITNIWREPPRINVSPVKAQSQ